MKCCKEASLHHELKRMAKVRTQFQSTDHTKSFVWCPYDSLKGSGNTLKGSGT